jgi:tRNA pseudouridine55 synthase
LAPTMPVEYASGPRPLPTRPRTVFRPLDGILLLDKPAGMSSNQALQRVRHLFRAGKAGHTGSLDPLATGLLPVCFGEATKIAGLLLGNRKAYEVEARLGATTDTDDADGSVLRERPVPALDRATIERALRPLTGRILQVPPIYSALKQGGEPLYAKARRGEAIDVAAREVSVEAIRLLDLGDGSLRLHVTCGSGTYVRSLVRDLGETLGCGAHVTSLRRLWVEPFTAPRMHTLAGLADLREREGEAALDACLLPVDTGLAGRPRVTLDAAQARALGLGQAVRVDPPAAAGRIEPVHSPGGETPVDRVAVDADGRVLGLVTVAGDGRLAVRRLFRWAAAGQSGAD